VSIAVPQPLSVAGLAAAYARGLSPAAVVDAVLARIAAVDDDAIWIARVPAAELRARARELAARGPEGLPLFGVPFAVKDNIDVAGMATTAACPAFAYTAEATAFAVRRLLDAGAILVGKTNLDQFATGLVGVRSPYGVPTNPIDPTRVPGGSSAGSAVAVARGLVAFALGTDTAGSGRVPAAFNGIVGLKPTRGLVSTGGVVPACRSLDCVSVFTPSVADACAVVDVVAGFDPDDPFARPVPALPPPGPSGRPRLAVPARAQLDFAGDAAQAAAWAVTRARLDALDVEVREIDLAPFTEAAALLYRGPWLAERRLAFGDVLAAHPAAADPTVRAVVLDAPVPDAVAVFRAQYRLAALKRAADDVLAAVDALVLPTTSAFPTRAAVAADPVGVNNRLGRYTNFMNLLDLAGLAVPAGTRSDGLPFGITFVGPAFSEDRLLDLAAYVDGEPSAPASARRAGRVRLAVCGAHLAGQPLARELLDRGARFLATTRTAPDYRLYALAGGTPARPGLVRTPAAGAKIEVDLWELTTAAFGDFVARVPAPLTIGTVTLADGDTASGFLCEAAATAQAVDITAHGGWRAYLRARGA